MARLPTKLKLLELLRAAIKESGWNSLILSSQHPFLIRIFRNDDLGTNLRVYIWNCTHGGGTARAPDEYRIQFTSAVPTIDASATTLLLGWYEGTKVFAAWDIEKHSGQSAKSPSAQIKEEALLRANQNAFSIHKRQNGENVIAFQPGFFIDYALNATSLHKTGGSIEAASLLNQLDKVSEEEIQAISNNERRRIISRIVRKYRAYDFRKRVLGAYEHRCAVCGVQLELNDAAHIIPVASDKSTDETSNGISLCKLHHAAFDNRLLSFDDKYKIEISESEAARLTASNLSGGMAAFKSAIRAAIILPSDRRDYPKPAYIKIARELRKWR